MNSSVLFSLLLSSVFFGCGVLSAQAVHKGAQSGQETAYVLGAEDQISVHVVDLDDVSDKPVRIDPNGYLDLPLIGRMHASGLSVEQLRSALAERLSKYIDSPQISINVLEYRSQAVSILGAVNNPGLHQLQGPTRLLNVISLAGGLRQDAGPKLIITRQMKWGSLPLQGAVTDASGEFTTAAVRLEDLTMGKDPAQKTLRYALTM